MMNTVLPKKSMYSSTTTSSDSSPVIEVIQTKVKDSRLDDVVGYTLEIGT